MIEPLSQKQEEMIKQEIERLEDEEFKLKACILGLKSQLTINEMRKAR